MDGYTLSRNFFDWCFENPDKINPNHTAIYFFAIEHCNRLGWKEKFGFPTQMSMDAIGIKKHETFIKYFNDLITWGFIKLIQKSQNQYSANIISIQSAIPKKGKALDRALIKHGKKGELCHTEKGDSKGVSRGESTGESKGESNSSIDKQVTKNNIGAEAPKQKNFKQWTEDEFYSEIGNFKNQFLKTTLRAFYDHWREKNFSGKMKFQLQDTWETKLRLDTWLRNESKFSKNGHHTEPQQSGGRPVIKL